MKFAKTIIVAAMMFGMGSLANAASVFQTVTINTASADALDIVFDWNGTPSSGLETLNPLSSWLPTWDIQLKTNPQPPEATAGIFVKPTHGGNPDAVGRTIYFHKDTLSWTVPHTATGAGHYDEFSLQYLSVNTDGSGEVTGAQLRLSGQHVNAAPVPVPAALWLFGSGLIAMAGLGKLRRDRVLDAIPS